MLFLYRVRALVPVSTTIHMQLITEPTAKVPTHSTREYWMVYREPGFLALGWFGSSPTPFHPLPSASCLFFSVFLCVTGQAYWWERWGAKSYDGEKDWYSMNHSTLSASPVLGPQNQFFVSFHLLSKAIGLVVTSPLLCFIHKWNGI
jgi:hypothetical protein